MIKDMSVLVLRYQLSCLTSEQKLVETGMVWANRPQIPTLLH